jgi:hypothetical protein
MQLNEESFITLEAFVVLSPSPKAPINCDGKKVEDKRARSVKGERMMGTFTFLFPFN